MRPQQKSNRNRGKNSNRSKNVGNVVNRVFDSAGPEGKVRGTPQQIIDKYEQLAQDAQTAGDRVTAENFLQHAEHYLRMLSNALAEQAAHQQAQQAQQNQRREQEAARRQQQGANAGGNTRRTAMPSCQQASRRVAAGFGGQMPARGRPANWFSVACLDSIRYHE